MSGNSRKRSAVATPSCPPSVHHAQSDNHTVSESRASVTERTSLWGTASHNDAQSQRSSMTASATAAASSSTTTTYSAAVPSAWRDVSAYDDDEPQPKRPQRGVPCDDDDDDDDSDSDIDSDDSPSGRRPAMRKGIVKAMVSLRVDDRYSLPLSVANPNKQGKIWDKLIAEMAATLLVDVSVLPPKEVMIKKWKNIKAKYKKLNDTCTESGDSSAPNLKLRAWVYYDDMSQLNKFHDVEPKEIVSSHAGVINNENANVTTTSDNVGHAQSSTQTNNNNNNTTHSSRQRRQHTIDLKHAAHIKAMQSTAAAQQEFITIMKDISNTFSAYIRGLHSGARSPAGADGGARGISDDY